MEKEKNYTPMIIAFGIIIFVVLVGVYYIGKSSNDQPQISQNSVDTSVQSSQPEAQIPPVTKAQTTKTITQAPATINYDLAENPNYLFSKNFDPNKVKYYGIGIGDPVSSINPSSIKHQQEYVPGLIRLLNSDAYMSSNGVVTGIHLGELTIDSPLFSIYTKNDVFTKLGWPDTTTTTSDYYVGANHDTTTDYYYISRKLKVIESDISGQTFILINING